MFSAACDLVDRIDEVYAQRDPACATRDAPNLVKNILRIFLSLLRLDGALAVARSRALHDPHPSDVEVEDGDVTPPPVGVSRTSPFVLPEATWSRGASTLVRVLSGRVLPFAWRDDAQHALLFRRASAATWALLERHAARHTGPGALRPGRRLRRPPISREDVARLLVGLRGTLPPGLSSASMSATLGVSPRCDVVDALRFVRALSVLGYAPEPSSLPTVYLLYESVGAWLADSSNDITWRRTGVGNGLRQRQQIWHHDTSQASLLPLVQLAASVRSRLGSTMIPHPPLSPGPPFSHRRM